MAENETACWQCRRTDTRRVAASPLVGDGNQEECEDFLDCSIAQASMCWRCRRTDTNRVPASKLVGHGRAEECGDHLGCIEAQYTATQQQLKNEYGAAQ